MTYDDTKPGGPAPDRPGGPDQPKPGDDRPR